MSEIDDFLAGLDAPARSAVARMIEVARTVVPDAADGKSYGMPALRASDRPLIGFSVSRNHMSLHPFSAEVVAAVADDLEGFSLSKGTVRFTADQPIPDAAVERIVQLRLAEITGG